MAGLGFTVSTTSSVAVPQDALVTVKRNVTVPIPATSTVEVNEVGVFIVDTALPVWAISDHAIVPLVAEPANVNDVGPDGFVWHLVCASPASAVGLGFTVSTTSSVAVPQDALVTVKRNVTVPIPATSTLEVNEVGVFIVDTALPV